RATIRQSAARGIRATVSKRKEHRKRSWPHGGKSGARAASPAAATKKSARAAPAELEGPCDAARNAGGQHWREEMGGGGKMEARWLEDSGGEPP
ncbi:hypothetical protein INR49_016065, partial [Caranx melampygus]